MERTRFRVPRGSAAVPLQGVSTTASIRSRCGDRLDCVCPADRLHSCFRKAEVSDLAFLNQVLHRSRDVLDWHRRVNTMLVEEVNCLDSESFE
jgi:hypothetical protein